ncbi:Structural maintenance of chromosomes protein 5 [Coemansia sp. RSA 1933]|nr:Structural maintenance of chromosomes protein 5 [Coemansia sp. RSA 1933]
MTGNFAPFSISAYVIWHCARISGDPNPYRDSPRGRRMFIDREIENRSQQLRLLDDVAVHKRNTLRSASADSFRALEWLEANRDRFGQHVFAPICLEASVNAPEYARLVESVVSASTLRKFVTQSDDDYRTFTREVNDRQKLRVDVVSYHKDLDDFRPPQPHSVLQQLGFDGYVLDFVEAPRRVLAAAPFRVVDELNQGMDQRNERLVHRLIVDTGCRPGSPQYFLITPKLLQDLEYHPLMCILCIYNGE